MKSQAAAEQRRHRAGPRAQRDDRADRQPAQPEGPELPARCGLLVVAARGERGDRRAAQRPQPDDARRRRERLAAGRGDGHLHPARRAQRPRQGAAVRRPAATARCSARGWASSCSSASTTRSPTATAIYAVLRGVGQASDGRGHGLLAPSVDGETLAIRRAYDGTGVDPASVSLVEAHGTGIPLGDRTEIAALKNVFGERRTRAGRDRDRLGQVDDQPLHSGGRHRRADQDGAGAAPPGAAADACANRSTPSSASPRRRSTSTPRAVPWIAPLGSVAPRRHRLVRLRRHQRPRDRRGGAGRGAAAASAARPGRPSSCVLSAATRGGADRQARAARADARRGTTARRSPQSPRRWRAPTRGEPVRLALVAKDATSLRKQRRAGARKLARQAGAALVDARRRVLRQRARRRQARLPVPGRGLAVHGHAGRSRAVLRRSAAVARLLAHALRRAARRQPHRRRLPARQRADDGERRKRSRRACTTWTSAARRCSSPARRCTRCCARSASSPT